MHYIYIYIYILPPYYWAVNGGDLEPAEKFEDKLMKYLNYRTGREADR